MSAENILFDLIKIDSRFTKSNKELIEYIKQKISKYELLEFKFKKDDLELHNLVVKLPGKSKLNPLLFVCHTDTVNPSNGWTSDPFKPQIKDNKIFGLGACDIKGSIASLLDAVTNLKDELPRDVYLIFDCDEEGGGMGGKEIIKNIELKNCEVVVCEPTDNQIIIGQKACIGLDIRTIGVSLHSSRTSFENNKKNNAIYKAIKIMNRLMIEEESFSNIKDPVYGSPTLNIGKIEGGNNGNSVADNCLIKLDVRLLPSQNMDEIISKLTSLVKQEDPDSVVVLKFFGESFNTDKNSIFVKKLKEKFNGSTNLETSISFGWNEAAIFGKLGEAIVLGPGEVAQAHKSDEFISIDEINTYSKFFKKLMEED